MPAALYSQSGAGCARCGGPCLANVPAVSYLLCGCSYSRPGIFSVGRRLFPALYTVRYFSRLCILPHAFVLPRTGGGVTVSCGQVCFALGQYSWITSFQFFQPAGCDAQSVLALFHRPARCSEALPGARAGLLPALIPLLVGIFWWLLLQPGVSARRLRCAVCPSSVSPSGAVFGVPTRGTRGVDSIARWNLLGGCMWTLQR